MPDFSDTRIQVRRGTSQEWTNAGNPTLGIGELAFVTDTNLLKIGNGVSPFDQLDSISVTSIGSLSSDPSPTLSADLDLNGNDIIGNGDIDLSSGNITTSGNLNINGDISASGTISSNGSNLATVDYAKVKANHLTLGSNNISNWVPSVQADMLRVTTTAAITIHGLSTTYYDKNQLTVSNNGPYNLTFANDSATAISHNRFYNIPSEDMVLASGETIVMTYDDSYSRWLNYTVARATRIVQLTEAEYNALSTIDPNTLYVLI
jgi:hypothetical protein